MAFGILALQGAVAQHLRSLRRFGVDGREVRTPAHLDGLDGLIIPGGESTTLGKLMARVGLDRALMDFATAGKPILGTCAGMILMARAVEGHDQPLLALMDIVVRRNAFGRQVESFEEDLQVAGLDGTRFRGVFIRAPYIVEAGPDVEIMAEVDGHGVLARQGNLIASAFHPELTEDLRLHKMFIDLTRHGGQSCPPE
ncbi:MAG: pyridoxal 5'-phosphate synthase glutaminase subunit PdxT [Armatimonadota bacterium]|nr:MAG: pyridoxal 5'-phosphate synthase glutaminase subunit PdxT [Armatimonadota bacterium]